ncbi:type IV toxin-antitoxin system AbiEi family antitoxin domain-containing protein [Curtobacterium sp. SP.BCo]|uniref:type IV toxin-antitoxin system AbiEi family antitoxin domain-containing protein n=1 Tax=Curtobacterium sp. SP.BCo TaxID=3435229 RepID=UPI003F734955
MGKADVRLIRTAGLPGAERRALERAVRRGVLERIRPGVLVQAGALDGLWPEERHRILVLASATRLRALDLVSHESACAVLGLPFVGPWPSKVHVIDPTTGATRVTAWFVRHGSASRLPEGDVGVEGFRVTTPARTAVDVASSRLLLHSLPVVDHVLREGRATLAQLTEEVERLAKGHVRAAAAIGMGSAASGSPAESVCRVRFRQLGVPEAVQQHVFARPGERTAVVDFWFPEQGVVVEVDGRAKYEDTAMLDGRTTADAHWQEKLREDFVRSFPEVRTVVRVTWADLMDPERLRVRLRRAGIPCR